MTIIEIDLNRRDAAGLLRSSERSADGEVFVGMTVGIFQRGEDLPHDLTALVVAKDANGSLRLEINWPPQPVAEWPGSTVSYRSARAAFTAARPEPHRALLPA